MSLNRFKGQVAVITGGSRGIGQAVALRLAQEGCIVNILDLTEATETLSKIKNSCSSNVSSNCASYQVDITDLKAVKQIISKILNNFNQIDIAVNSAGVTGKTGIKAHQVENDNILFVMNVNFIGTINICKAVLHNMLKRNYGRIINVASISGKEGNPGQLAYASSKGAVIAATKTMGKDYAKTGITINSIAPAVIETAMVKAMPISQVNMMKSKIPMNRCGSLQEISSVISFMASKENSFSTGFCFDMTGGRATY
jgi:NAD(P)-dependent dehydrogenase (short-subunit alcohol dehydrogenase family)